MKLDRQIPFHLIKTRWTFALFDSTHRSDQMRTLACWFASTIQPGRIIWKE
ncbi:hypothetical protein HPDFL43_18632 [Hoeflea phototrophica DFL-43]|jgi:hypothetical protein|uniref:Transposase n=1 Tax=Hoeflea phototrophica (strain DSM 17068 / NCIMB 14078 / DFL-43) TaxID=411684 RepID=A9CUN3_HOEPD|nr:hypothetical protein HPDFL43_18632 [Hoeflea phototrophica DFL-43]